MSRSRFLTRCIGALLGALLPFAANAQQAILQGGAWTAGHALKYGPNNGSQPVVVDTGAVPSTGTVDTGTANAYAYYPSSTAEVAASAILSQSGTTLQASAAMSIGGALSVSGAGTFASTLAVTGHTTFEGVTSTGATGTGNLVYSASPTFTGTVTFPTPWTLGGVSVTSTGTQLNYLNAATGTTGTTSSSLVFSASPTFSGTIGGSNVLPLTGLAQIATNTVLGNATSGTANVSAQSMPSCSTASSALIWTTNTGFGCNTLGSGVTTIAFGTTGLTPSGATAGAVSVAGTLIAANGGTGFASYAVGDVLYASTTTTLAKLADVATGQAFMSGGVGVAPAYSGSPSFSGAVTAATGLTATTGGLTVSAGGATVTGNSTITGTLGGLTGLTVASGGASITGNTSILSGSFTASGGAFAASPASANVVMSPTGTGVVTISPATAGTMNNMVIGGSTALAGTFTTATASTAFRGTDFGSGSSSTVNFTTTGGTQLQVTNTGSAARNVTITGSAAGNPTIATTAGSLAITPAIVGASTITGTTISDSIGNVRSIQQSGSDKTGSYTLATTDNGQFIGVGSGGSITIPDATFSNGNVVTVFNNTTGNITITCTITTAYIAGTDADKATMTLATRGLATLLFLSGTVVVVSGNVT